jgi:Gas vesicle synthesis protein GvpL/GvpF.
MSTRGSKKRIRQAKPPQKSRALYVYAIGESERLAPLIKEDLPDAIESDARIEMIVASGLGAIVSAVPIADYGEDALEERLGDASWAAVRVMRHEQVVEHFARRASIIPLRFGTIYLRRDRIEQMLEENRAEFLSIIERLREREEWGVNVYVTRATLMEAVTTISPRLREFAEQAAAASPGQAYLLKKKIEALRADESRVEIKRATSAIERELALFSEGASRLRVMKDETAEQGEVAAKLAFLVPRARFDEFRAAAEKMAEKYAASGFKLELTGPWPVYNFADQSGEQGNV